MCDNRLRRRGQRVPRRHVHHVAAVAREAAALRARILYVKIVDIVVVGRAQGAALEENVALARVGAVLNHIVRKVEVRAVVVTVQHGLRRLAMGPWRARRKV